MKLENLNIIIVSNEPWGNTWYSKHNYAWQLSKKNKIIFINPADKFSVLNLFRKNIYVNKPFENIIVLTYKNILPVRIELLRKVNEYFIFRKINKYFKKNNITNPLFWTFDPIRLSEPEMLNPSKIILHAVDKYLFTFPSEKILAQKADTILCVSSEITESYLPYNKNVHTVFHAIPSDEFLSVDTIPKKNNRKKAVYIGNIDKRLDFEYTEYIINRFKNIDFYFVGKINPSVRTEYNSLSKKYSNVYFLGEKPYKELKYEVQKSDFCFLFKDVHYPGNNISSHKMLQYFAQGKPIFCTELYRYQEISNLLYMENDKNKMQHIIANFIKKGEIDTLKNRRIEYAQKHTFENALSLIETYIN